MYDLAIIGGGPAGIMAGIQASKNGASVILLEKNNHLGIKLLITGKGRCNITNAEEDKKKLIQIYGQNGKFLYSAFNSFSNWDTINFFENLGLKTKVERGNRVFPVSDNSKDVLYYLKKELDKYNVEIKYNSEVQKIITANKKIEKIILKSGEEIIAKNYLIATGGKSYPNTGSTGDGYRWLKEIGHNIVEPIPALTPIIVKENWIKKLEGLSLKNVEISLWKNKKITSEFGEALFTNNGLSGPIILNLSNVVRAQLSSEEQEGKTEESLRLPYEPSDPSTPVGMTNTILSFRAKQSEAEGSLNSPATLTDSNKIIIQIDFKPALDYPTLDKRIQKDFEDQKNKQFKNALGKLLPQKLIPVIINLSGINENKKINEITKEERKKLIKLLKEFELNIKGLVGFEKAIVTSGGIDLKEVDPKTCKSKLIDNLYLAGEVLDINGPTGGYNLQVAWSTGYLVGNNVKL